MAESGDYSLWNQILQGRPSFGDSGFDVMNALAAAQTGGAVDPRLSQYYDMTPKEGGGFNFQPREGSGFGAQGHVQRGGRNLLQVGGVPDDERIVNRDRSQFEVDPHYGLLTGEENVHITPTWLDRYSPYLVGAGLAGPALFAALGAGAGAGAGLGEGGATGAFDMGGSLGFGGSTPIEGGGLSGMYGGSTLPDSYWGATADSGGVMSDAAPGAGDAFNYGGLDPETWAGNGGMPVSQNGIGPGTWTDQIAGSINNPSSIPGRLGDAASSAGNAAMRDPMRALGLVQMLGGAIGGLAQGNGDDGGGGDAGPTELGDMGWRPPTAGTFSPAMYDPSMGSPFSGWLDQYQQSLRPLGRMYGG